MPRINLQEQNITEERFSVAYPVGDLYIEVKLISEEKLESEEEGPKESGTERVESWAVAKVSANIGTMGSLFRNQFTEALIATMGEAEAKEANARMQTGKSAFMKRVAKTAIPLLLLFLVIEGVLISQFSASKNLLNWLPSAFDIVALTAFMAPFATKLYQFMGENGQDQLRRVVVKFLLPSYVFAISQFVVMIVIVRLNNYSIALGLIAVDLVGFGITSLLAARARTRLMAQVAQ